MNTIKSNAHMRCENCDHDQFSLLFSGSDKLLGIAGNFDVLECQNCGLYLIDPKLNSQQMEKYYPDEYICYLEAIEDERNPLTRFNRYLGQRKRSLQVARRVKNPGKILDIGCATGIFLNEMQKRGWECQGVEPDQTAVDYARRRFGLDVYCGVVEDANLPAESFDVVTLWDVLEHVYDLNSTMAEIKRVLKPGGVIIAILPNANAFERYWFKEYWVGWEVPRHYRTFTPKTITDFLAKFGFEDIEIFSFTGRHGAFMLSIQFWLNSTDMAEWKKKTIMTVLGSFIVRMLTLPIFMLFEMFNRSTEMSFAARKPAFVEK
ncbi:MAG: putative S-adenosylmethionine-dependent methyltransferase [Chloroflexi bacterium ADurb.Bin120]|jgi:2-polyprenyl-3-methyl-5-hydroxy-6-metoxy-1,4-benzoquinol methylase|uniref:Putative Methyltransferase type 11 n=1 Tax=Candidatus Brevifilum fermentans TaxID=1986204 RepID=A0A1Y6K6C1_9CHLR|nr:class I SAM-dependent methyltransferase [Brevefilum fermentans]OQB84369.1 MAG: putative S-adenosylmethionine-dependent methyltransferase [Chloroflexi bacterium ADurb.Bin120]SMX55231.1 putative Methyltransferase type 11 [Brevefilum fermentans]HOM67670.1 class I SAM-dependent methyltransferase [Brevefilum fermentans]